MRFTRAAAGVLLPACLVVTSCKQQAEEVTVHWLSSPIRIDGRFEDWDSIPTSRMHKDHAVLKLASDSQYLCLFYVTDDLDWVRTIKMTGLTLYFNRDGSHDKEFFVRYRTGPSMKELLPEEAPSGSPGGPSELHPAMREQLLESERADRTEFTCFVRNWIVEKSIPVDGRQGPQAAFGRQDGRFAYEFRIPLRPSEALYYGLGTAPGAVVGIGAEWGGMPRPVLEDLAPPGSTDMGGTSGQGSGLGDFGGSGPPPGSPEPPKLPEKEEVWVRVHLANVAGASMPH